MDFSDAPDWFKEAILNRFLNDSSFMNMSGYNFTHEGFVLPIGIKITIAVVYMVVCVVGLVGNCLVMYVIIRRKPAFWDNSGLGQKGTASLGDRRGQGHANPFRYTKMKTATNIYIFNLALADFLVLITLPFQGTDVFLGSWPFGKLLCKIVIAIDYYNMFTSTFTLTMMSVDRYIAVCHPVKALDMRTPHKAKVVNICIWALASVIGIPAMVMGDIEEDPYGTAVECAVVLPQPCSFCDAVFGTCVFIFSFVIPVAIITICYTLMVKRLKSVRVLSGSKEKDRMLRRITRMVLIVVAVFVVCWTPIQIMVLVRALGLNLHNELTVSLMHFCIALGYVNSSLNPVLYAFLDENFKRCFKEFCYPSSFRMELQRSSRMKSIAKEVSCNCKHADGTSNPA